MTYRTSTGSIVPEIQTPALPTGLTKALYCRHPKSRSVTVTPWFLKIPDSAHRGAQNSLPKTILARRTGKLRSELMNFPPEFPDPATSRPSAEHSSFQRFSFSRSPLFPRTPLFPALRSGPSAVSGAPAKCKFLAVKFLAARAFISFHKAEHAAFTFSQPPATLMV